MWKQHCSVEQHNVVRNLHVVKHGRNEDARGREGGGK